MDNAKEFGKEFLKCMGVLILVKATILGLGVMANGVLESTKRS